jgi:hypothetical protein
LAAGFEQPTTVEVKILSKDNHSSSAVYGLGFIGAAIYFISQATTFWTGVLGFLKALVWPAFLVYEALKSLGA